MASAHRGGVTVSFFIIFTLEVLRWKIGALSCSRIHHWHEGLERHELLLILPEATAHVWTLQVG